MHINIGPETSSPNLPAPSLADAVRAATETRRLEIGPGALSLVPQVFQSQFNQQPAVVVCDANTFRAAGETVCGRFLAANHPILDPFIFQSPDLYAEFRFVEELEAALRKHSAIPVAVGSGTISDLTKLAAHRVGRRYMSVATAASMDGYTAFGASITFNGSKQTFLCPAPAAVVADLDVIRAAPAEMSAWGYTDLIAKVAAGADWILADALGVEPIHEPAWAIAQGRLRELVADPAGVRNRAPQAIAKLVEGLMLGGFAMQAAKTSRAASGAEHQFSHLWDMQHHKFNGRAPSHGFKVGIGTLASIALYERMMQRSMEDLDINTLCTAWPTEAQWLAQAGALFGTGDLAEVAAREIAAKAGNRDELHAQLLILQSGWPALCQKLRSQLLPFATLKELLQAAGAPVEPEQIGISRQRLRDSFRQAFFLRRRFTILDVAVRTGMFDGCIEEIFGAQGTWPIN